jgi:hypothetical protein
MLKNYFASEIGMIQHAEIRGLVEEAFDKIAPEGVERAPSSSSGKHHPPDERGEGGWLLHARRVFRVVDDLARSFELTMFERDILYASALLHDLLQYGEGPYQPGSPTVAEHPILIARALHNKVDDYYHCIKTVADVIQFHSGIWGPAWDSPYTDLAAAYRRDVVSDNHFQKLPAIIHLADYIASREHIVVEPIG